MAWSAGSRKWQLEISLVSWFSTLLCSVRGAFCTNGFGGKQDVWSFASKQPFNILFFLFFARSCDSLVCWWLRGAGIGPAVAIPAAVSRAGLELGDVDVFELNEAFASQATYCVQVRHVHREREREKGGGVGAVGGTERYGREGKVERERERGNARSGRGVGVWGLRRWRPTMYSSGRPFGSWLRAQGCFFLSTIVASAWTPAVHDEHRRSRFSPRFTFRVYI